MLVHQPTSAGLRIKCHTNLTIIFALSVALFYYLIALYYEVSLIVGSRTQCGVNEVVTTH